jgi:hypothetical protein
MKRLTKLSLAISAALCAGTAVADVPNAVGGNDFDQYTTDAGGNIILNNPGGTNGCPIGGTCQVLEATSPGILQQKVTYGGTSYFQTIIVDNETGPGIESIADPTTFGFRMENYVNAGDNGSSTATDLATQSVVQEGDTGAGDAFTAEFEGQQGILIGADATSPIGTKAGEIFRQINELGATNRMMDFAYEDGGGAGKRMALGMTTPNNEGQFMLRRVTGYFVPADGTITMEDSSTVDYLAGDNLQVTHIAQAASGDGAGLAGAANRFYAETQVQLLTDNEGQTIAGSTYEPGTTAQDNFGPMGTHPGVVISAVPGTPVAGIGPFVNWDAGFTALFGTEPNMYETNAGGTGATVPAGGLTGMFGASNPPWNAIVTP